MTSLRSLKSSIFDKEERKMQYQSHIRGLNAYDRHNKFMKDYVQFYGKTTSCPRDCVPIKTDQDTIREGHRFIISEDDDMESTWEKRLVKRYYDKLFKEAMLDIEAISFKLEIDEEESLQVSRRMLHEFMRPQYPGGKLLAGEKINAGDA
ncbi:hypothetical protein ZIOFF_020988 [Zingiber officinale]|uniref:Uncharacterized protein n=1 Tax=Zingiber officinale TaxID=94328 RepID=A0A8J5LG61_ZINOF|nr:hypothetical protein ZIOFF_020988 [Zingiber officinale]